MLTNVHLLTGDTVDNFIVEPQQIYLLKFTFHLLFKAKYRQSQIIKLKTLFS